MKGALALTCRNESQGVDSDAVLVGHGKDTASGNYHALKHDRKMLLLYAVHH